MQLMAAALRAQDQPTPYVEYEQFALDEIHSRDADEDEFPVKESGVRFCDSDLTRVIGLTKPKIPVIAKHGGVRKVREVERALMSLKPGAHAFMKVGFDCGYCSHSGYLKPVCIKIEKGNVS